MISLASAGALAGTPTSMGSFSFTVEATDGTGCKARHTVRLDVTEVVADFSGAPRIVAPGSTVSFTDASAGSIVSRQWAFGDGNNSNAANPTHAYQAAGRYNVSLRVDGPTTSDLETKPDYVLVSSVSPGGLVTGQGPAANAAPLILGFDAVGVQSFTRFAPYPTAGYGANVGSGDIDGTAPDEILTGPGPSVILGPHVRAFRPTSTPIAKVSFYAYSTLSYGVHADGVGLDGDAPDEIVATPGPGGVFGPHVRGFNFDGGVLAAMPGVSFYAYGTLKFGARAAGGDIDGSGGEEILTGPGPGAMFSTQVRGFRYGPPVAAIAKVNFVAFTYTSYGANVAGGNVDGDAYDEILVGGGPDPDSWYYWSEWFSLFDYDGQAISVIVFEYQPFGYGLVYGVEVAAGDLDGNPATDEILVGQGPDPTARQVAAFSWSGASVVPIVPLAFVPPYVTKFGVHVTAGQFGF
ncbi:MAG: PKD domain-containing protein [Acidobacteriota bacterium]